MDFCIVKIVMVYIFVVCGLKESIEGKVNKCICNYIFWEGSVLCIGKGRGVFLESVGRLFVRKWYLIFSYVGLEGISFCLYVGLRVICVERE